MILAIAVEIKECERTTVVFAYSKSHFARNLLAIRGGVGKIRPAWEFNRPLGFNEFHIFICLPSLCAVRKPNQSIH